MNPLDLGLNKEQEEAVSHTKGPLLVLAGAGSGKTRVLVRRIQRLVESEGVAGEKILAITFTRKAAGEMRNRIALLLGSQKARGITISTFHSLGSDMLSQFGYVAGLKPGFGISDETAARARIRHVLQDMKASLSAKSERPSEVLERITAARNLLVNRLVRTGQKMAVMERYHDGSGEIWREDGVAAQLGFPDAARFSAQYAAYSAAKRADNVVDYDDLVSIPTLICLARPEIRRIWTGKWEYVLVDEYQDTDTVQEHLLGAIVEEHGNICAVGDDEQAIYSWRGANVENIRTFAQRYEGCKVVRLEENYRSSPEILEAANAALAARTRDRTPRKLHTANPPAGPLRVWRSPTQEAEAAALAADLKLARENGEISRWSEAFVLYRVNYVAREIELALKRAGIPYRIANQPSLHEKAEARTLISFLRLADNPYDMVSLEAAGAGRGLGAAGMEMIRARARAEGVTAFDLLNSGQLLQGLRAASIRALRAIAIEVSTAREDNARDGVASALRALSERLAIRGSLIEASSEAEAQEDDEEVSRIEKRIQDLDDLLLYAEEFEQRQADKKHDIRSFLEDLVLSGERAESRDDGQDAVTLMSVHAAKGLEAKRVYVAGVEESLFPLDVRGAPNPDSALAEEGRLFYVAMTRAHEHLVLSSARTREIRRGEERPAIPSRYLSDIPETSYRVEIKRPDGGDKPL